MLLSRHWLPSLLVLASQILRQSSHLRLVSLRRASLHPQKTRFQNCILCTLRYPFPLSRSRTIRRRSGPPCVVRSLRSFLATLYVILSKLVEAEFKESASGNFLPFSPSPRKPLIRDGPQLDLKGASSSSSAKINKTLQGGWLVFAYQTL